MSGKALSLAEYNSDLVRLAFDFAKSILSPVLIISRGKDTEQIGDLLTDIEAVGFGLRDPGPGN